MFKRRFLLIVFVSGLLTAFSVQAFLPVIIASVARKVAVVTAESVAIQVVARGFAANDPYVITTASMGRKTFAARIAALRGTPWAGAAKLALGIGLAIGLDVFYDPDVGFHTVSRFDPNVVGHCKFGSGGQSTLAGCLKQYSDYGVVGVSRVTTDGINSFYYFLYQSGGEQVNFILYGSKPGEPTKKPITDTDVDKFLSSSLASPDTWGDYLQGLSEPVLNKLFDGATVPYNPTDPTPEMAQLKADYRNGLLQAVDPAAAHYVTPEQFKQVQDLVAAENAANTDEGAIDALNEKMKQPITQAQYEESNLKAETANATSLSTSLANISPPLEQLKLDNDFILDKVASPPEPPSGVDFFKWTLPTGSCSGFAVDLSVGNGKLHTTKQVNEFCPFYESVAHPLLFWFLNIATFLYLFWLWDRSVSDMAR